MSQDLLKENKVNRPLNSISAYRLIDNEMIQVENELKNRLTHNNSFIDELVRYCFQLGGKRLRPALVLLCAKAFGTVRSEHILAAAALEMIHTATLIHDDILDGAEIRRHLSTINVIWNSQIAVLTGDFLFTEAMQIITELDEKEAYRMLSQAISRTCEGELLQTGVMGNLYLTEDEYFSVIGGKTAALLECACRLGAFFAGADPEVVCRFAAFGYNLGVAFQIIDDVLDLTGEERNTGKTLGTYLQNRKTTLPLIRYMQTVSPEEQKSMLEIWNKPNLTFGDADEIKNRLLMSRSVDYARQTAFGRVDQALDELRNFSSAENTINIDVLDNLSDVAQFILRRKF